MEKIAVTGASGLVGGALCSLLGAAGSRVYPLVRRVSADPQAVAWDIEKGEIDAAKLEGIDAVVHLAGENIAGRWSAAKKKAILESRVKSTRLLCETLAKLKRKPPVLVSASATGIYGERGDAIVDEGSAAGGGFLAEVCKAWEAAAQPARDAGIRVVHPRIGVVLSGKGGALAKMLLPFKLCVGGRVGTGEQYWSWIALEDVLGAIVHALKTPSVAGALNLTAPAPATNAEFTRMLGKVLGRPTIFPVPAFAARMALGEMAEALLLTSTRAKPKGLLESGYKFKFPELEGALRQALGK